MVALFIIIDTSFCDVMHHPSSDKWIERMMIQNREESSVLACHCFLVIVFSLLFVLTLTLFPSLVNYNFCHFLCASQAAFLYLFSVCVCRLDVSLAIFFIHSLPFCLCFGTTSCPCAGILSGLNLHRTCGHNDPWFLGGGMRNWCHI